MALDLKFATKAQLVAAFRSRYRDSAGNDTLRLAEWVIGHLDAADLTDAEMAAAFGLNAGQWTALKARMKAHADNAKAARAAKGE